MKRKKNARAAPDFQVRLTNFLKTHRLIGMPNALDIGDASPLFTRRSHDCGTAFQSAPRDESARLANADISGALQILESFRVKHSPARA
jgi:hypothetical protein